MRENAAETTDDLIELLDRSNRKERYFLICNALGIDKLCLDDKFRKKLGTKLGIDIPPNAGVWMDYHLDWLAAAITKWHNPSRNDIYCNPVQDEYDKGNKDKLVQGNQEDIDLLIAFKAEKHIHLVFLEAKGYSPWDNKQMESKTKRLEKIFGQEGTCHDYVKPHFCLVSPSEPKKLETKYWPKWMKKDCSNPYYWLRLNLNYPRLRVTRSDSHGKSSKDGDHFSIVKERMPSSQGSH